MSYISQPRVAFSILSSTVRAALGFLFLATTLLSGQQSSFGQAASQCSLSALSLNLHGNRDAQAILAALRQAGGLDHTDVMLFQEVQRPQDRRAALDEVARLLNMQIAFAPEFVVRDGALEGLALLSRYPIVETRVIPLQHNELLWKSRRRVALAVSVETPTGRMQIYNLHLDTRINLKARLKQLQPAAEEARAYDGPVLLGGDLNTNPFRWVVHTLPLVVAPDQGSGVLRYMNALGYTSALPPKTATSRWFRMQLDWLFVRNLNTRDVAVRSIFFSDHHAVHACLQAASSS